MKNERSFVIDPKAKKAAEPVKKESKTATPVNSTFRAAASNKEAYSKRCSLLIQPSVYEKVRAMLDAQAIDGKAPSLNEYINFLIKQDLGIE